MKIQQIILVLVLSLASLKSNVLFSQSVNSKTYAEVSVKEGGKWEGRKYIGGTFKNVQKLQLAPEHTCLLYTSPSPRDYAASRMPSSA